MKKNRAAVLTELSAPLELLELEVPEPKFGQVLVQIAYSGLCHTQLHEIRGKKGPDRFLPHTLGHEGSGVVVATGPGVNKVKAGDHVVLTWIKGSGAEVPSAHYQSANGIVNSGAISTLINFAIVSENRLVPIRKDMPLRAAALLGCAFPTGGGIINNTAKLQSGQTVAIFGVGGIGLSSVIAAIGVGASQVIAVDVHQHKLNQAIALGATHGVLASEVDPVATIHEITAGQGVDVAVEAAGRSMTIEAAFLSVRLRGGLCVVAGNVPDGDRISIDPFDLIKGRRIVGSWGGETDPDRDIPRYVNQYMKGGLSLDRLISHEFPLQQVDHAFLLLEQGQAARVIIGL
jgi:S-(hydroxymethyl)glutathione dehydrogenase/alcohol dehydrogenase